MSPNEQFTLHDMLDEYSRQVGYCSEAPSAQAAHRLQIVRRLKEVHEDIALSSVGAQEIQSMIDHWRNRPVGMKSEKPIALNTARHYISELHRFFLWADLSSTTAWSAPSGYHRLETKPQKLAQDRKTIHAEDHAYTIQELRLLYQHAREKERLILLLGLNCGLSTSAMGRLKIKDFRIGHSTQGTPNEAPENILEYRHSKTRHIGRWLLWPETVVAFKGVVAANNGQDDLLFKDINDQPLFNESTPNSHATFARLWSRLNKRVQQHHPDFRCLPLSCLRRTPINLMQKQSVSQEALSSFLGHAVSTSVLQRYVDYSPDVAKVCFKLRELLRPVIKDNEA